MSGENAYINPIIEAMVHSAKFSQDQEAMKQRADQFNATNKIAQQHQQLLEREADYTHDFHKSQLDLQAALHASEIAQHKMGIQKDISQFIANGGKPTAFQNQQIPLPSGGIVPSTPSDKMDVPGIGRVSSNSYATPEENINRLAAAHRAQVTAQGEAQEPFAIAGDLRKRGAELEKLKTEHANKLEELKLSRDSAERQAAAANAMHLSVAHINGANHLRGIQLMHQLGLDDGTGQVSSQAKQLTDAIFSGTREYSKLNPDEKRAVDAYNTGTGELKSLPTDTKGYTKKLEAVSGIGELLKNYQDLAQNFSRDSPGSSDRGNQNIDLPLIGTVQRTKPGSDLESRLNSVKAMGGQLASYYDQQNRKSDSEILRQVTGAFDPKSTVAQNLKKLEDHIKPLQATIRNTFVGMKPERVNAIMAERGIEGLAVPLSGSSSANSEAKKATHRYDPSKGIVPIQE